MNRPTIAIGDVLEYCHNPWDGFEDVRTVTVNSTILEDVKYLEVVSITRNGKRIWPNEGMTLVATNVKEDQLIYTWERMTWLPSDSSLQRRTVERCTVAICRHSDDSGIPTRDDPGWKIVE